MRKEEDYDKFDYKETKEFRKRSYATNYTKTTSKNKYSSFKRHKLRMGKKTKSVQNFNYSSKIMSEIKEK